MRRPSLESLLAHEDWVRSLAVTLTGDVHAAEDLAQETWLAVLTRPPEALRSPRGWLRRVLRNLRTHQRRDERRARAQVGSPAPVTPAVSEIVEREGLRRSVVAAVLDLDDVLREVILLRFYEGLPPRAVAAELGVPVETVRTRLRRAKRLLKTELLRRGIDRSGLSAVGGTLPWLKGGIVVTKGKLAVVAVLVGAAASVATVAWRSDREALPPHGQPRPPLASASAQANDVSPLRGSPEKSVVPAPAYEPRADLAGAPPSSIRRGLSEGRVQLRVRASFVDETDARPVGHVAVQWRLPEAETQETSIDELDDLGEHVFDLPRGACVMSVSIRPAEARGKRSFIRASKELRAATLTGDSEIDVQVCRGATLGGWVTNARTGLPIAGARVSFDPVFRAGDFTVRTDVNGRFLLDKVSGHNGAPFEGAWLAVVAEGYVAVRSWVSLQPPRYESTQLDFRLEEGVVLEGRVTDESGRGVAAGVCVHTWAPGAPPESIRFVRAHCTAVAGADGRFTLPPIPPAQLATISARSSGYVPTRVDVDATTSRSNVHVQLTKTVDVEVVAVDEAGDALAPNDWKLYWHDPSAGWARAVRTSAQGYLLAAAPRSSVDLSGWQVSGGRGNLRAGVQSLPVPGSHSATTLLLRPVKREPADVTFVMNDGPWCAGVLHVVVQDSLGRPVQATSVRILMDGRRKHSGRLQDGKLSFGVRPGRHTLTLEVPGYRPTTVEFDAAPATVRRLELRLERE